MFARRSALSYKAGFKRKQVVQNVLLAALIITFLSLLPVVYFRMQERGGNERRELQSMFETGAFDSVFAKSRDLLVERPLDFFLLTVNGFSAYQLGISQVSNFDALSYISDSIWSLRRAMLLREGANDGRIFYVLGKAYFHKGASHADLAVRYLEKALAAGFTAPDIAEFLGLAHASLLDFRSSVAAFTVALEDNSRLPSDVLLLSIARSYVRLNEYESAKYFLARCLEVSRDSRTRITARLLLGYILYQAGDFYGAEAEYLRIIEEEGENAEVSYQLGVLYASMGDMTRARAEWRRALRIDPIHGSARNRLL